MKGIFISLEGIEGTGKSTQARLLADHLKEKGYRVIHTMEPGGTRISLKIRELLLSMESSEMDHVAELLLYNAARVQHIKEIIGPALERGDIVITDRFSDSTVAYQGYARGIDLQLIDSLDIIATKKLRPDVTILFDIDVRTGLARNKDLGKNDRLELEDISFHEKVRKGFLQIAARETGRIKVVDCSESLDGVRQKVFKIVSEFLEEQGY
jgi:dTMP kinase